MALIGPDFFLPAIQAKLSKLDEGLRWFEKSDGWGAKVIFKLAKQLGATALHRGDELPA